MLIALTVTIRNIVQPNYNNNEW